MNIIDAVNSNALSSTQKAAIQTDAKYALILAGAGSGKTTVIMERARYLLQKHQHIKLYNVLILAFTNKAAQEIRQRVIRHNANSRARGVRAFTFHSFGLSILTKYKNTKRIVDEKKAIEILKESLSDLSGNIRTKCPKNVEQIMSMVQLLKDNLREPLENHGDPEWLVLVYAGYQQKMADLNYMDFGDILLDVRQLFIEQPNICRYYQMQIKHILVDEYQDINFAQYVLLRMLLQGQMNDLYCVADDDQLIYEWRGANIKNIIDFKKYFPIRAEIMHLDINYRSTAIIVRAANHLIQNNVNRHIKTVKHYDRTNAEHKNGKNTNEMCTDRNANKIEIHKFHDDEAESYGIAAMLEKMLEMSDGGTIGVLLRKHEHIKALRDAFNAFDIQFYDINDDKEKGSSDNRNYDLSDACNVYDEHRVFLMTIHASKGMEFDTCILPCWEEDILPANVNSLEEERRIAYVSITRAKRKVIVSYSCFRRRYGEVKQSIKSRFISELPSKDCVMFDHASSHL